MIDTLIRVVGWTLIHSVWQGAVIIADTATVLALIPRASARVRYAILCGALLTHLTAPVVTAVLITPRTLSTTTSGLTIKPTTGFRAKQVPATSTTSTSGSAAQALSTAAPSLTARMTELSESAERFF